MWKVPHLLYLFICCTLIFKVIIEKYVFIAILKLVLQLILYFLLLLFLGFFCCCCFVLYFFLIHFFFLFLLFWFDCFYSFAITNNVGVNICAQVFVWTYVFISLGYIPWSGVTGSHLTVCLFVCLFIYGCVGSSFVVQWLLLLRSMGSRPMGSRAQAQ